MTGAREALLAGSTAILLLGLVGSLVILRRDAEQMRLAHRLTQIRVSAGLAVDRKTAQEGELWVRITGTVGSVLARSGLLPVTTLAELKQTLGSSGLASSNALAVFIGSKVLLAFCMLSLSLLLVRIVSFSPMMHYLLPAFGGVAGLLAPDFIIRRMRSGYLSRVQAGIPDALDMMVICTEAGLGLEPGIDRVAAELVYAHADVAREFRITANEMRLIADRSQVLTNLGLRTGLESFRRLGITLNQATQFGTPLSHALRTLAAEMRQESMTRYEARAARLSVLLTFPMIVFILPCVFIVVIGPAALRVMAVFGKL